MHSPRPIGDKRDPQDLRPRFQRPRAIGLMGGFRAASFAVRTASVAVLLLLTALAAVFAFSAPAQAQDDSYVDLSVEVVSDYSHSFTARNHGTATAYDVTMDIELADQAIALTLAGEERRSVEFEQKSGTSCSGNIPGTTCINGTFPVGTLAPGEEKSFYIIPKLAPGLPCCPIVTTNWTVPAWAVVKSGVPEEDEHFKADNSAVSWISVDGRDDPGSNGAARSTYWLEASVDDLLPEAGDTVKFTFRPLTGFSGREHITGAIVRLKLDNGMGTPTATPPTDTTFAAATGLTRTWDWDIGELQHFPMEVSTTLDNPLPAGVAVSDLCLTAELTARPDNRGFSDRAAYTTAEFCLREDPVTLLQNGETDLFTIYPCVGVTTYLCSSSDTVEMVVNGDQAARAAGINRDEALFDLDNVAVKVNDLEGRVVSGGNLSWVSTDAGLPTSIDNSRLSSADWTHFLWKIASVQLPTGGNLSIGPDANRNGVFVHTGTKPQHPPGGLTAMADGLKVAFPTYIRFESLGTYIIDFTQVNTHNNGTTSDTTDDVDYTATGRYTFHVGPVAELETRDGGSNPELLADQRAFTIVAVNNGPDDAPAAQVTVTGLNTNDYVSHSASHGTFSSTTGVWTIGELREDSGYYRATGHPQGWPTLTIITSAAEDTEITAAISNTEDYQVCIDSSGDDVELSSPSESACTTESPFNTWHTTPYYDYISDNSTATIKAKDRTGADLPSLQSAQPKTAAIEVTWDAETEVNGRQVTHYEVEWSADGDTGWTKFSDNASNPRYVDTDVESGETRYYRVRAVNDRDHKGPWSQPIRAMVETVGVPGISVSQTALTISEGETGEYEVSLKARPIANVTINIGASGEVTADPGRLTFTPTNWETAKTVVLTARQDRDGVDDTLDVTHNISTSDAEYARLTVPPVAVTVIDDDSDVSIAASDDSINEGETVTFTLTRQGKTQNAVTVTVNVAQRGDFLASGETGQRTVNMGAGNTTARFTVATDNDSAVENAGSFTVSVLGSTDYFVGSPSSVTVSVQDDDGVPGQPGNLTAVEGDQQVALSWSAAPVGDAAVLDYSYRVRRSDRSTWDPNWTELPGGSGRRSYIVSDLTNGQEYVFQVRARNDTGDGAAAEVTANPLGEPEPPDVTVTPRHESLLLTWTVADDGGRDITEYQVQWKSGNQSFDASRQATATTGVHTIPSLINGTEYRVRVQARNEAGWSGWSSEQPGTPVPRPATSVSITTDAEDGVSEPFRVTFTFTDEDHEGNRFGVRGFDVDDIEVRYSPTVGYEFSLKDFREEVSGFVYSARLEDLLEGTLNITVKAGAAQSTHDGQQSTSATHSIRVEVPEAVAPAGTEIWATEMTVGKHGGNARGYIDFDLSVWNGSGKIGSLSDSDAATDDDNKFTYAGKNYIVGEVSYVPAWSSILFAVCSGIEGVNRTFDLYLDDQNEDHDDLTLSFDSDEVKTSNFTSTIDGVRQTCVEYRWQPRQVDWQEGGKVNVRLVR